METLETCQVIREQLSADGPLGTLAAVGASDFVATEREGNPVLTFRVRISPAVQNWVEVELTPLDVYSVRLIRVHTRGKRRFEREEVREELCVYCDQLCKTVYRFCTL